MQTPDGKDFDVVVVGAGPAGAATALALGRAGVRTLLLDRERFPRDKPCGDALSNRATAALAELGLLDRVLREPHVPVFEIAYYSPGGHSVVVPLVKLDADLPVTGLVCRRIILDDMLLEAAREVATTLDGCQVHEILVDGGRPVGVRAGLSGGRDFEVACRAVVGADGAGSLVAGALLPHEPDSPHAVAATAYYDFVLGTVGRLEIHFLDELLPGCLWLYPTEMGLTNVGVSAPPPGFASGLTPADALLSALASPALAERFAQAERFGPIETALMPLGHTMRTVHGEGFVLVGDAAGLIHPCSCQGIGPALVSAQCAAQALIKAHETGDYSRRALFDYPDALWKRLGPTFRIADRLLSLRTAKAVDSLIKSAKKRPHNAGWISGVLIGHAMPSEELDALMNWLDFFNR